MNVTVNVGVAPAAATSPTIKLDTPTTKEFGSSGWCIMSSELGCGARLLQGWSSGIGISGNDTDFEKKLFQLMYLSLPANQQYVNNKWTAHGTESVGVPIGVGRRRFQFLTPKATYILSSKTPWIERFEAFVKKHDLGTFTTSHEWLNILWGSNMNKYATWTWNGKLPKSKDVGITDWKLPE